MLRRLLFLTVTLFWLVMNFLLFRRDFQAADIAGSSVPLDVVWEKMIRAADDSFLYVIKNKKQVGDLRWSTEVVNLIQTNAVGEVVDTGFLADGMVHEASNYKVEINGGRIMLGKPYGQVRYEFSSSFSTNDTWEFFELSFRQKEKVLRLYGNRTNETLTAVFNANELNIRRELTFKQLKDPQQIATALIGPMPVATFAGGLLGGLSAPSDSGIDMFRMMQLGLRWEARQDWLKIGHSKLKTFRISMRLPEDRELSIYISRSGEILRVLLPDGYELRNRRLLLL